MSTLLSPSLLCRETRIVECGKSNASNRAHIGSPVVSSPVHRERDTGHRVDHGVTVGHGASSDEEGPEGTSRGAPTVCSSTPR